MIVSICIGSSCHLKGSKKIVELMKEYTDKHHLQNEVTLAGSFCMGKCSAGGVTVAVDDEVFTGITPQNFNEFFEKHILNPITLQRGE